MRIFMVCLPVEMSCLFSLIAGYTCLSPFSVSGYAWHATALDSFAPHENSIYLTTGKLHPGLAKALASVASVALHYVMIDLDHMILACWYTGTVIHPYSYYHKIFSKIMITVRSRQTHLSAGFSEPVRPWYGFLEYGFSDDDLSS